MSNEGEKRCPLCAEEMDWTDRQFKPCKCGYQVCVWCWHHIIDMAEKDENEGRCPACRTVYDKDKIVATQANFERAMTKNCNRKTKPPKAKPKTNEVRKDLTNVRVIQRKMAYVIGLPLSLADEDLLQRKEYFGQYGKISKISLSRTAGGAIQHFIHDTFSIYVTYSKEEEAVRCIQSVHGFVLEGRFLRASFGTAKYCHTWLRNVPCNNPTCLYLHTMGADEDSFGKDEIAAVHTRNRVQEIAGSSNSMLRRSGNILPPPVEELDYNSGSSVEKSTAGSSPSDSARNGHLTRGFGMSNKTTSFVDIVGRSSSSGPVKDENSGEDRGILDLCSDLSSVTIVKDNHVEDAYSISVPYNSSSSGHLVSRLPMDGESKEFFDEPFVEDMMAFDDSLPKDSSNLSQRACFPHSSYPAKVSEDSGDHSVSHRRAHSSSSFSIDQSSVHNIEDETSLPFTCVNSVLNESGHELKFQTSVKSDRIYRSSNSSNEEIVEHLQRTDDEILTNDDENGVLDAVESSIISNIMSVDFDSCDDRLTLPHGITELLDETDDQHGSSWNSYTSGESGLFIEKDGFAGQLANLEPSVNSLGQGSNTLKEHYFSKPQYQASRTPSLVPPGFSVPSREVPPGFSTYKKTDRFPSTSSGTHVNTSHLPSTLLQMPSAGNNSTDPATLSRGEGRPTNGLYFSGLNVRPAFNQQMGALDNETRLWLLMQQQAIADQNSKYSQIFVHQGPAKREMRFPGHVGDERSALNNVYGYPSRLMDQCQSYDLSSFALLSQRKFGNGHISNGYQHGFDEVQRKNEPGFAEPQKLGLNKYFSGHGDLMFQMASSGDVYTRVFGV